MSTLTACSWARPPTAATVWLSRTTRVRIEKELYFPVDTVLTVTAGETVRPTFHLESTIKPRVPINTLVLLSVGYNPNGTSFGAMLGFGRKNGAYVGFRSDFASVSDELECNSAGIIAGSGSDRPPFYREGTTATSRMSVTAGYFRSWAASTSTPVPVTARALWPTSCPLLSR